MHELCYVNPRKALWPYADYIVGNPPFIGNKRMRLSLGDGYAFAIRQVFPEMPGDADFVMYWWQMAATRLANGDCRRFGLITTNSITQPAARSVVAFWLNSPSPIYLDYALADHPWVDSSDGASVRISMTVAAQGTGFGQQAEVHVETLNRHGEVDVVLRIQQGLIHSDLRIGADVASAQALLSNTRMSYMGVTLVGDFKVAATEIEYLNEVAENPLTPVLFPYLSGKELSQTSSQRFVIDCFGMSEEMVRQRHPQIYQRLVTHVRPVREQNQRKTYRDNWWIFGEPRPERSEET